MNCFKYLLFGSLLLTGQLPTLGTLVFRISLSFFSLLHWNIRWSTVCMPCLHGQSGLPIIFNLCKYDGIFPWPVIIVVTFGSKFKFTASLISTLGKNSLVLAPFVCHPTDVAIFLCFLSAYPFLQRFLVSFYMLHSCFEVPPSQVDLLCICIYIYMYVYIYI